MLLISQKRIQQIKQIHTKYLTPLSKILMWINTVVGIAVAIAHVYIPVHTPTGLIMGIVLALCGALTMQLQARFTQNNIAKNKKSKISKQKKRVFGADTFKTTLFILIFTLANVLSSVSLFFSLYTSVPLLVDALALSWSALIVTTISLFTSAALALGSLLQLWMQTFDSWLDLRTAAAIEKENKKLTSHALMKTQFVDVPTSKELLKNEVKTSMQEELKEEISKTSTGLHSLSAFASAKATLPKAQNRARFSSIYPKV